MELPVVGMLLLVAFASMALVTSHPIASPGVLPKEYYERQNLPDIPGYIPVYIKHDDEPTPKWKTEGKVSGGEGKVEEVFAQGDTGKPEVEQVKQYPQQGSEPEHKGKGKKVTATKHTKTEHKE